MLVINGVDVTKEPAKQLLPKPEEPQKELVFEKKKDPKRAADDPDQVRLLV